MKHAIISGFLTVLAVASPLAYAGDTLYYGGKIGFMLMDPEGYTDPVNVGAMVGYRFWRGVSFEGEVTTSATSGNVDIYGVSNDVSINTYGAYAAWRSGGETFFKARVGFAGEQVDVGDDSTDDSDASYGLGYGWKTNSGMTFEVEYTVIFSDANYLSFSLLF